MRPFEAALLLALVPAVLGLFLPAHRRPRWVAFAPFLALAVTALHLALEGWRWQMVPTYALALLLCAVSGRAARSGPPPAPAARRWWRAIPRVLGAFVLLVVAGASAALSFGLPMFELPEPTGEHAVGTLSLRMLDESRPEIFTEDPGDKRDLMVQAWYPAEPSAAAVQPEPFWGDDPRRRQALARALGQPGFMFDHLARIPTHSYPQAKLADGEPYPVLIFSHGYAQGFSAQNTVLMEELASHGYAVFSIGHPHESSAVIYPDGRIVTLNPAHMQKVRDERKNTTPDLFARINGSADKAERVKLVRQFIGEGGLLTASVHLWAADTRFVLDQLEKLNAPDSGSPFAQRLDLSRVGVLGMSFGGTAAGQICLDDERVKAGVNLDGTQYGDLLDRPLQKPFMFVNNPLLSRINEPMYENSAAPAWFVVVKDTRHFDFTDFPLVAPVYKLLGVLGKLPAERVVRITNAYTLAFFEQHLKGRESPLLRAESTDYPEVTLQVRNGAAVAAAKTRPAASAAGLGLLLPRLRLEPQRHAADRDASFGTNRRSGRWRRRPDIADGGSLTGRQVDAIQRRKRVRICPQCNQRKSVMAAEDIHRHRLRVAAHG